MAARQLPLPGEIIKKSNALCRARWSTESVWELRLVALLASKVRKDDTDLHVYEISATEMMPDRKKGGKDYQEIANVVDRVMSRVITIKDEVGRGWTKYNVFYRCRYRPQDGILELGFHPDLRWHYLNLQKNFAEYNLIEYLLLPSIYSQRIYEFCKSWADKPETTINLDDLQEFVDAPETLRANFAFFRRRVLEKAHKDINGKTSLFYEWEPIKKGRSVVAVRFIFNRKRTEEVKAKKKRASSETNNKLFLTAVKCRQDNGDECKNNNKSAVCEICKKLKL